MQDLTLGEAARAIGVRVDTLRRWDHAGKPEAVRDERDRRRVPPRIAAAITRAAVEELELVEGTRATATVKATWVMIERGER